MDKVHIKVISDQWLWKWVISDYAVHMTVMWIVLYGIWWILQCYMIVNLNTIMLLAMIYLYMNARQWWKYVIIVWWYDWHNVLVKGSHRRNNWYTKCLIVLLPVMCLISSLSCELIPPQLSLVWVAGYRDSHNVITADAPCPSSSAPSEHFVDRALDIKGIWNLCILFWFSERCKAVYISLCKVNAVRRYLLVFVWCMYDYVMTGSWSYLYGQVMCIYVTTRFLVWSI